MDKAEMTKALKILEAIFAEKEREDLSGKVTGAWIKAFKGLKAYLRDKYANIDEIMFVDGLYGEMNEIYEDAKRNERILKVGLIKKGSKIQVGVFKTTVVGRDSGSI